MKSLMRIYAVYLRQIYLIRFSPPRMIAILFWPMLQILMWGFFNKFLIQENSIANLTLSTLLGASLFAALFERTNAQVMWGFLEDYWSRNLGNILITPIKSTELLVAYLINGLVGVMIGMSGAWLLAYVCFDYSVFKLGGYALLLMVNIVFSGWCMGLLLIALIFRFGTSGEFFGWMIASVLLPFVAVYYPVSVLPAVIQPISWILPPTYMFETLRQLVQTGSFNWHYFQTALALNCGYFILCAWVFFWQLQKARTRGGLFSMSE